MCVLFIPHDTQVMVETANGFKIGVVKFIGETDFAPGEWIGVALERRNGEPLLLVFSQSYLISCSLLCRQTQRDSEGSGVLQV